MNTFDVMKARYSVRSYKQTPVEPEKLQAVLEAGRVAPTACNNQPQKIYVVQTAEGLERLAKAANIHNPPLALIICADRDEVWVRPNLDWVLFGFVCSTAKFCAKSSKFRKIWFR